MLRFTALAIAALLRLSSCVPITNSSSPTAQTRNGTYVGRYSPQYNQDYFLGLPYALPPVGSLRFRNPVSLNESFSDVRPATQYSSECYGYGSDQWNYQVSEDCLYINVVRPAGYKEHDKLPVAFWIHGGGFVQGGGIDQRYNLSFTVQNSVDIGKPIIAVSLNYRLSAFGFLSGSEEVRASGSLNLGLKDQRLALHWIQENIEGFGGDPEQVTIYGESAGASSVGLHLTAYNGRDDKLFRGAIMQSGSPIRSGTLLDYLGFSTYYNELTRLTGCANQSSTLECLRALPIDQLNIALNTTTPMFNITSFLPVVDGDFIAKRTSIQLEDGDFVKVPIIIGANSDEGTGFSPSPINTTEDFYKYLTNSSRAVPVDLANQLLEAYPDDLSVNVVASLGDQRPGPPYGAQFRRSASYVGDQYFIAPRRQTCKAWAAAGVATYCYRFNAIPAGIPAAIAVTHFQEVAFVFLNLQGVGYVPAAVPPFENKTQNYFDLAKFMNSIWVSFIHDLDPNSWRESYGWSGEEELWPKYDVSNPLDFVFDANVTSYVEGDTFRKHGMDLINANALNVYLR